MQKKRFCHYCGGPLIDKEWEGRVRRFCKACNGPIYENPVPAACAIVTDAANRLLLVERSVEPQLGKWCLPGGYMELGETPEACALRELREETGLVGTIAGIFGAESNPNRLYDTVALICYRVARYKGEPVPGDDASDIGFFPAEALPEIAFDSHWKFIRQFYGDRALADGRNIDRNPRKGFS